MINSSLENTWQTAPTYNHSVIGSVTGTSHAESRPIVLISGIGENANSLRGLARELDELGENVATIDTSRAHDGHGYPATMGQYARFLMEASAERFADQPVNLFGHSWGAYVVAKAANDYPERVANVIIAAAVPSNGRIYAPSLKIQRLLLNTDYSAARLMKDGSELYGDQLLIDHPDFFETLGIAHEVDLKTYARQFAAVALMNWGFLNIDDPIGKLKQKVLVMSGTNDPIAPYQNAKAIHDHLRGSSLCPMPGGGHLFPVTQAKETAKLVHDFTAAA